jgi:predicted tellurium resistance membrane protein TerC
MDLSRDFDQILSLASLISVLTLTVLEIVLGIDNVIFIAIAADRLPYTEQPRARAMGLSLALIFRIGLLLCIKWILGMGKPIVQVFGFEGTGRDLVLFSGGLFLLIKTSIEIYARVKGQEEENMPKIRGVSFAVVTMQIVLIDILLSFDSILTAVSIVNNVLIMIFAVILAMILMLWFSGKVSDFINRNPTIKILALAFLLMIGILLIMDALHANVDRIKPYLYCSMAFAFLVELLNMRMRRNVKH